MDAEIPSPAAGTLVEVKHKAGETVPVNQVVGVLETEAGAAAAEPAPAPRRLQPKAAPEVQQAKQPVPRRADVPGAAPAPAARRPPRPRRARAATAAFVSPVVRKIAAEHGIDPARVPGHGRRRPRHEEGHPRLHREGREGGAAAPPRLARVPQAGSGTRLPPRPRGGPPLPSPASAWSA